MIIRNESPDDVSSIATLIGEAFASAEYPDDNEAWIVCNLRRAGALAVSLVAESNGRLIGHIAFSPVRIDGRECGWFGLGPISVVPAEQRRGVGSALVNAGLERLKEMNAQGCVLLGEPGFYMRFGFRRISDLKLSGVPEEYFLALPLREGDAEGEVTYHPAFYQSKQDEGRPERH